jgi:hypothetical protein
MAKLSLNKNSNSLVQPKAVLEPIIVERIVEVIKEVPVIQTVERIVEVPVEVIKEVEKIVNVPVEVVKTQIVEIPKEIPIEVIKVVEKEVIKTEIQYMDHIKVHYKMPRWAIALIILESLLLVITNI